MEHDGHDGTTSAINCEVRSPEQLTAPKTYTARLDITFAKG